MIGLTDSQYATLEYQLNSAGLTKKGLYDDLLDHFYCLTEKNVSEGMAFEPAYQKALSEMAPDGFQAIEVDLVFLLTFKFQLSMKRMLYLGGYVAAVGQSLYVLFRTLHWPGANAMLLIACAALFLLFLPALIFEYRQSYERLSGSERLRIVTGIVAVGLFGLGSAFKVFHWPSANIQILLGVALLSLVFFPLFFWQQYQKSVNQIAH